MNRVLSWKIASGVYAYIFKPDGKSYISNRISESSPIWKDTINTISEWSENDYITNFNLMKTEVSEKYGVTLTYKPEYWDYKTGNENLKTNIVLLAGKDGVGGYGSGSGGGGGIIGDGESYEELADYINGKIDEAKKAIEEQNEKVKEFIHDEVVNTIGDAKEDIEQTKQDLNNIREEFSEDLKGAKEALDRATELFGDGEINSEKIQEVFSTVDEYGDWIDSYSGVVADLQADYDTAEGKLGIMGAASSVTDGLFSRFATSLNAVSGTVGAVERTMDASMGKIHDIATWYDASASTVTEASRLILASAAVISDTVKYMEESGITAEVERQINGSMASIIDTVKLETSSGITYIEQSLNGLSATVATEIAHLDATTQAITAVGNRMNAMDGTIDTWITKTDSAMSMTNDLREHWSVESGKLSTVATLTAETDADGNIIYYISGSTGNEIVVWKNEDGKWTDGSNIYDNSQVYVHFSETMASYIQQMSSAVTISVMGPDNMTAAIKVAIQEDVESGNKAIIQMVADEVVITGDMIAQAIYANQANIGGIIMGAGVIKSSKEMGGRPYFMLDGNSGTLYAQDANIQGVITATELRLGSAYGGKDIAAYATDIAKDEAEKAKIAMEGWVNGFTSSDMFKDSIVSGYVTESAVTEWLKIIENKMLTPEQVSAISKSMIGAEISISEEPKVDEYGRVIYTAKIGNKTYDWTTVEGENFLLLEHTYSADGKTESFFVDKNGLLRAHNAWIQGKIYASEGTFTGRIEANEGYFHGSVSADSGYFKGDVVAKTLKVGTSNIDDYISARIPAVDLGDCVKFGVKNGSDTKYFQFDKDGLLTANNAVIQGNIVASEGFIGEIEIKDGGLSGPNFSMTKTGLTMTSSLIQPYTAIDIENSDFFSTADGKEGGNFFFSGNTRWEGKTIPSLLCDTTQIGRRISITNNSKGIASNDFAIAKMTLPSGKYFFEDGRKTTTLSICNELVDLIGYGNTKGNEFYGWSVIKRMPFMTEKSYGHSLEALCTGIISTAGEIEKFKAFDKTTYIGSQLTVGADNSARYWNGSTFQYISSRNVGTNKVMIRMPDTWFDRYNVGSGVKRGDTSDIFVQLTPVGTLANVCYGDTSASAFTIQASTSCKIAFSIYNRGSWRCLPSKPFLDVMVLDSLNRNIDFCTFDNDMTGETKGNSYRVIYSPEEGNLSFSETDVYKGEVKVGGFYEYFDYKYESEYNWDLGETVNTLKLWAIQRNETETIEATFTVTVNYDGGSYSTTFGVIREKVQN